MEDFFRTQNFSTTLEAVLREGAQKLLQLALQNEVDEFIELYEQRRTNGGGKSVKRNGYLPGRNIQTGIGLLKVRQPRIRGKKFSSAILPPYMRRIPSLESLVPALYLKGISTGNMQEALCAILGERAKGLSSTNIVRMKESWEREYEEWKKRDLSKKRYVYIWADGIYFNVRLSDDRPCLLVIIGALEDGTKELIAIHDGHRESKLSWKEVLLDLKKRGLDIPPLLAIADGALGFWSALEEIFPTTRHQRCWVHKTANILDKMPKSLQESAKRAIHNMYQAPTKREALDALDTFLTLYEAKYPKAAACLIKDKDHLFTFYDFPAVHWQHIRSTNPIESTFATVRHRTRQTKGCGSIRATLSMVFQLAREAQKCWRKLRGYHVIPRLISGAIFRDGEETKIVA